MHHYATYCFIGYEASHLALAEQCFWLLGHQPNTIIRSLLLPQLQQG